MNVHETCVRACVAVRLAFLRRQQRAVAQVPREAPGRGQMRSGGVSDGGAAKQPRRRPMLSSGVRRADPKPRAWLEAAVVACHVPVAAPTLTKMLRRQHTLPLARATLPLAG